MSAALSITPASGSITAKNTICRIDVTDADESITQRLKIEKTGETTLVGPSDFNPSDDGKHTWFSVMFPSAGTWTAVLYESDDEESELATLSITVA